MTGTSEGPIAHRTILNANRGVTNIIERDVIRGDMAKVTDLIFDKLKAHYGPFSSFAGLDSNRPLEDTVFTKDGINIIKAIEFASPLEDWVRRAVSYIGSRMESAAGDGTTSSMMFACGMLKNMSASIDKLRPLSYYQFREGFNLFIRNVKEQMNEYTISAKDADGKYDPKKVYDIAYAQAYTSSHGNEELSDAVAKMFEHTPPEMWPKMTFMRRRYENPKLFEVVRSEGQYQVDDCEVMTKTVFNKDSGEWLEYNNATLVVINGRMESDNVYWKTIEQTILKSTASKPVAIFAVNDYDNVTFGKLMALTSTVREDGTRPTFCVFGVIPTHQTINDFTVLQAICGASVIEYSQGEFSGRPFMQEGVYVKYDIKKLVLGNLYPDKSDKDELTINVRPYYTDQNVPYFREFADTIQNFISARADAEADLDIQSKKELGYVRTMYNKLVYDKTLSLIIGGNTFDNLAMFDVVDDVIRATIKSLEEGVVVSNNKTLYWVVSELALTTPNATSKEEVIAHWFAVNTLLTLESFSDVVLQMLYPNGKRSLSNYVPASWCKAFFGDLLSANFNNFNDPFDHGAFAMPLDIPDFFSIEERKEFCGWWFNRSFNVLKYDSTKLWTEQSENERCIVKDCIATIDDADDLGDSVRELIVQPANADIVMLERFGEIALKFILTERVIVSGTAYVKEKK